VYSKLTRRTAWSLAAALAVALAAPQAAAKSNSYADPAPSTDADALYLSEKGLRAFITDIDLIKLPKAKRRRGNRNIGLRFELIVKNRTDVDVDRPLRLVVSTNREVLNADGFTANGKPFVTVCDDCNVAPGRFSPRFDLKLGGITKRGRPFWPRFLVEYEAYDLNLLHFADIDGIGPIANARNFSGLVNLFRGEMPENTLVVSTGDNWIPGPAYAAGADEALAPFVGIPGSGRADVAILNELGVAASAIGNHEFDEGVAAFAGIIASESSDSAEYPGAQFPYLSANVDFSTSDAADLVVADGQPAQPNALARSAVVTVDGEPIGLVGAASPTFPNISTTTGTVITPPLDDDADFDINALAAEIQSAVDGLTAQGIDKIIVLSHMQVLDVERSFAPLLTDVDIIIGGGSNSVLLDGNDVLRLEDAGRITGPYPETYTSAAGEPVLLVNVDGDYKYLGRLLSAFDLEGRIVPESLDPMVNGAYATDATSLSTLGLDVTPDAEVTGIIEAVEGVIAASEGNVFGITNVYIDGRRATVRTQEANAGNLTADANLAYARAYDPTVAFSLKNGGGIRDDIGDIVVPPGGSAAELLPPAEIPGIKPAGGISQADISNTLRFNNGLVLLTLTDADVRDLFEQGIGFDVVGETQSGRFPQVGGIRFEFSASAPIGSRIQTLELVDETGAVTETLVSGGTLVVDPAATYRLVTLDFLVGDGGRDGYVAFPDDLTDPAVNFVELEAQPEPAIFGDADFAPAGSEQDALAEYLSDNFLPPNAPFSEAETPRGEDQRIVFLP